nr:NAD-dependent epimerase/dehydratase family protein [Halegenticoccus tardaugens]
MHAVEACRALATSGDGGYEFVEGDVRDAALVSELVGDADAVFHQAAQAGVRTSVDDRGRRPRSTSTGR